MLLAELAKLRTMTIRFVMSVRLSVRPSAWNNSASTGRILMKFDIGHFLKIRRENSSFVKIWKE